MIRLGSVLVALLSVSGFSPLVAGPFTITFDELPTQTIEKADMTPFVFKGVTYDFKVSGVDSMDATFNATALGSLTYVDDPVLEGNAAGVLTLDFAQPTSFLSFGIALDTLDVDVDPAAIVYLLDPSLAVISPTHSCVESGFFLGNPDPSACIATSRIPTFSEGAFPATANPQFHLDPGTLVRRVEIHFDSSVGEGRFALDNLTYEMVPEPAAVNLTVLGLAAMLALGRRRRSTSG